MKYFDIFKSFLKNDNHAGCHFIDIRSRRYLQTSSQGQRLKVEQVLQLAHIGRSRYWKSCFSRHRQVLPNRLEIVSFVFVSRLDCSSVLTLRSSRHHSDKLQNPHHQEGDGTKAINETNYQFMGLSKTDILDQEGGSSHSK